MVVVTIYLRQVVRLFRHKPPPEENENKKKYNFYTIQYLVLYIKYPKELHESLMGFSRVRAVYKMVARTQTQRLLISIVSNNIISIISLSYEK